jgi:hypothetical protein
MAIKRLRFGTFPAESLKKLFQFVGTRTFAGCTGGGVFEFTGLVFHAHEMMYVVIKSVLTMGSPHDDDEEDKRFVFGLDLDLREEIAGSG